MASTPEATAERLTKPPPPACPSPPRSTCAKP
ncbi:hypothetical protein J2853_006313 [Streptosporangium lutulentum]|uniref:Uncharacterized protein n=1 Tax=Streptosporangium lutulentum TaxID=1461250 RepID=A0ABT9QK51_9ACTN|nr:hypothetical protein [Streptosporangium lutulentum]